jgi:hypothetical protein
VRGTGAEMTLSDYSMRGAYASGDSRQWRSGQASAPNHCTELWMSSVIMSLVLNSKRPEGSPPPGAGIASKPCIRWIRCGPGTQPCASAAKLEDGGFALEHGTKPKIGYDAPPTRIVIDSSSRQGGRAPKFSLSLSHFAASGSSRGTQAKALNRCAIEGAVTRMQIVASGRGALS